MKDFYSSRIIYHFGAKNKSAKISKIIRFRAFTFCDGAINVLKDTYDVYKRFYKFLDGMKEFSGSVDELKF